MTPTPTLPANLGFLAEALGAAEQLPNGTLSIPRRISELRRHGNVRLPNFYSPPLKD
jgi:hypothetical protein